MMPNIGKFPFFCYSQPETGSRDPINFFTDLTRFSAKFYNILGKLSFNLFSKCWNSYKINTQEVLDTPTQITKRTIYVYICIFKL